LTTVALAEQFAPVTGLGSALALAPAAAEGDADAAALSEAAADGAADAAADAAADGAAADAAADAAVDAAGLEVLELHAASTTTIDAARIDRLIGLGTELMAPPAHSPDRHDPLPGVINVRPA
jgi:hypothetical protein